MMRKLMVMGIMFTFLIAASAAHAEDVFVTQKGTKYHKEMCRLIKKSKNLTKLEKQEAVESDYGPCGRCYKEDLAAGEKGQDQEAKLNREETTKVN